MHILRWFKWLWFLALVILGMLASVQAAARTWDSIPEETFKALGIPRDATPKQLYDAVTKRYRSQLTKGKFAKWWEPVPIDQYLAPSLFYKPPDNLNIRVTRDQCVTCHTSVTHGWVVSWQKSVHANLDVLRRLPTNDVRSYKKAILAEVEDNLRSMGLLKKGQTLRQVGCIDCHMGVGRADGNHATDLRMPDRATCGTCHVRQFAEAESERDVAIWPHKQWPNGHPSHAVDYTANVETAIWAGMQQREVAAGCTLCHVNQTKCDTCHTRHEFSTAEARKPQACAICHNGVDHNEYENYLLSKHGTLFQTLGQGWNWNARLADAIDSGGMTAPTCQFCHFEYKGSFSHNLVRKVRWGFLPFASIADNLDHPWFRDREQAWQQTCSRCHSPRFTATYLDMADKGIRHGVKLVEESRKVVEQLYEDGLLVGQKTNRPAPPAPDKDEPGGFFSLFFSRGNNPTMVDRTFAEMWEQHIAQYMKALQHVNPGGWTYSAGWSDLVRDQTFINEQATLLREKAALEGRVTQLEKGGPSPSQRSSYNNRAGSLWAALGIDSRSLGLGLLLAAAGTALFVGAVLYGRRRQPGVDRSQ